MLLYRMVPVQSANSKQFLQIFKSVSLQILNRNATLHYYIHIKGVSKTTEITKMKFFVALVNSHQPLISVTKNSILDTVGLLGTPLQYCVSIQISEKKDQLSSVYSSCIAHIEASSKLW